MTYGKYIAWKIGLIVIFLLVAAAIFSFRKLRLACTSLAICGAKTLCASLPESYVSSSMDICLSAICT